MTTYGACIISRNDDYGQNLLERATYCLNSMIVTYDEVMYVDWNTDNDKPAMIEEIQDNLIHKGNLKWVRVTQEQAKEWTWNDPEAQNVCETQARNVGLRRMESDFLVSMNIDCITPKRHNIERVVDTKTFFTTGVRTISLYVVRELGARTDPTFYMNELEKLECAYPQQPSTSVHWNDRFSLVSNCGDMQIAHRDIWHAERGFEERFVGRAYMDSNIQMKATLVGYGLAVDWSLPIWHVGHEGGFGGSGKVNNVDEAFTMTQTTNPETWGHSDIGLEIHRL